MMQNRTGVDYSTRDYEGFRADLIEMLKIKIPEYTDFSSSDAGIVLIELLSHGLDILSYYNDVVANEVFLSTARERESVMKIVGMLGYTMANTTSARFRQLFEITPQEEDFIIPKGFQIKTKKSDVEDSIIFETEEELVIPAGMTGLEQDEEGEYLYTVSIIQGYMINGEVLGTSNGTIDQEFNLSYKPVLESSVELFVDEGEGLVRWNKVNSFIDSNTDRKDYKIKISEQDIASVVFGNGYSGKIPDRYINGIVVNYRVGGGIEGNVAPNTIVEIESNLAGIVQTYNPYEPYEKARERETIMSAKVRAPAMLRSLDRAVTLQDFEDLALTKKIIRRANAIKNSVEDRIDIVILPTDCDMPLETVKEILEPYYDSRALLGMDYAFLSATLKEIDVEIEIKVLPQYVNTEVEEYVEGYLRELFTLGNYDFGVEVAVSELIREVMGLEGIKAVKVITPVDDIQMTGYELPKLRNVTITATGGR